ncbi:MAG TPA: ThiF family adenylyltransferase [Candidatus Ozemobacteraceae bacterium]|nr:ThiF family adenylyltransferase [Candidatus Ozemobacteraceae bacterium]
MGGDETRFYRTELLIGPDALKKLEGAHVAVFGMGGVGSYAVEGLARAGVGHLTLVDFDTIGRTNLNRQIMALESTIGRPKVDAMGDRVLDINPACVVERHQVFFDRNRSPVSCSARIRSSSMRSTRSTRRSPSWSRP